MKRIEDWIEAALLFSLSFALGWLSCHTGVLP